MKISVVIPCYNAAKTLRQCVDSVLNQTYPVVEILIIDDGSKDESVIIADQIIIDNPSVKIVLFKQVNSGPSKARNLGIKNAIGTWIAFLDSDDIWFSNKIETQVEYIKKYPDVALISTANSKLFFSKKVDFAIINFKNLLYRNFFETSTVMVKTDVMNEVLFFEPQKYSEDYRAWLSILSEGYSGLYINKFLAQSIDNKSTFGESGLSKNIYGIEKGEWSNFIFLLKSYKISYFVFFKAITYSTLKFIRRFLITKFR